MFRSFPTPVLQTRANGGGKIKTREPTAADSFASGRLEGRATFTQAKFQTPLQAPMGYGEETRLSNTGGRDNHGKAEGSFPKDGKQP